MKTLTIKIDEGVYDEVAKCAKMFDKSIDRMIEIYVRDGMKFQKQPWIYYALNSVDFDDFNKSIEFFAMIHDRLHHRQYDPS